MNKKSITKEDLAINLSKKKGFSISFSKKIINNILDILKYEIKTEKLNLKNIGSFKLIKKKERLGRNPKTKENFIICSRKTISFSPSEKLLKKINN